ncbi:Transcription factor rfx3 [Rhizophlyctis rosea]|nr:Transcription factor rfx3 [Rhizophlyctis rosea]
MPDLPEIDLPPGLDYETTKRVLKEYKEHCEAVLERVCEGEFGEVEDVVVEFWWGRRREERVVLGHEETIMNLLLPNVLQILPLPLIQAIRAFSRALEPCFLRALTQQPPTTTYPPLPPYTAPLTTKKMEVLKVFIQQLRRHTTLNHLAQATSAVLENEESVRSMVRDWERIDWEGVREMSGWVVECGGGGGGGGSVGGVSGTTSMMTAAAMPTPTSMSSSPTTPSSPPGRGTPPTTTTITSSPTSPPRRSLPTTDPSYRDGVTILSTLLPHLLRTSPTITSLTAFLESLLTRFLDETLPPAQYTKSARAFLMKFCYFGSLCLRDLTLRSAGTFGTWHLVRMFGEEYLGFLVEQRVVGVVGGGGGGGGGSGNAMMGEEVGDEGGFRGVLSHGGGGVEGVGVVFGPHLEDGAFGGGVGYGEVGGEVGGGVGEGGILGGGVGSGLGIEIGIGGVQR